MKSRTYLLLLHQGTVAEHNSNLWFRREGSYGLLETHQRDRLGCN
jgi:hypothetical protein